MKVTLTLEELSVLGAWYLEAYRALKQEVTDKLVDMEEYTNHQAERKMAYLSAMEMYSWLKWCRREQINKIPLPISQGWLEEFFNYTTDRREAIWSLVKAGEGDKRRLKEEVECVCNLYSKILQVL